MHDYIKTDKGCARMTVLAVGGAIPKLLKKGALRVHLETIRNRQNSMDSGMIHIAPASAFAQPTLREKPTAFGRASQPAVRR